MAFEHQGASALDYQPCRYGDSKLVFRGPRRRLDGCYVAALGGSETYGKFVPQPWPRLLEVAIGLPVVNFGCMNAGIDVFVTDQVLVQAAAQAAVTVIQVLPPENMSNRFYTVHPRRNDRFLRASPLLRSLFREVDFADFHFTGHLLGALQAADPDRFAQVETELRTAWGARMKTLLARIPGPKVLLSLDNPLPPDAPPHPLGPMPHLITSAMMADLMPLGLDLVHVAPTLAARTSGIAGMGYAPLDEPIARRVAPPAVHAEIAEALERAVLAGLEGMAGPLAESA
ncbi:DUF6473 family protein [Frigidibacter sp. MR17.24]|uniref:DUF6473 family protein n=1 Tax=Frigidibacter sp. MR17.24 TaxID=3127345 RepID=UPI003012A6E4